MFTYEKFYDDVYLKEYVSEVIAVDDSVDASKITGTVPTKIATDSEKIGAVAEKPDSVISGAEGTLVAVELKETIFFPEGGGQSSDAGKINDLPVIHVRKKEGHVYHYVLCPQGSDVSELLQVGMPVRLSIDWDRRFDNMQRHCGEHILSGVFFREYGGVNKGFHMGHDYMTIDIDFEEGSKFKEVTAEMAAHAEFCANQVIWANAPVSRVVFDDLDSAKKLPLRKELTIGSDISVVTIGDTASPADCVACCGTHPSTAGQVGLIKILKVEPNKGMSRVYCEAGGRAYEDYCKKHDIIMQLCNKYSAVPATLQEQMARDEEKIKAVRTELHVLKQSVIRRRSEAILRDIENDAQIGAGNAANTALVSAKDKIYVYEYNDLKADDVFAIGRAISSNIPKLLLLISAPDNTVFLISDGTTCNCGMLVKDNAHIYNGKGGGKADNARAIFPNREGLDTFIDLLEKHLR